MKLSLISLMENANDLKNLAMSSKNIEQFIASIVTDYDDRYKNRKLANFLIKIKPIQIILKNKDFQKIDNDVVQFWLDIISNDSRPPIMVDNDKLIDGHHKLEAYKILKFNEVPVIDKKDLIYFYNKTKNNLVEYHIDHRAPNKDDAPIYNLSGIYPEDIYSANGARYYGDGYSYDQLAISIIKSARNKPNLPIVVYRAVPKILTNFEKIEDYKKQKAYILKNGKIPPYVTNWNDKSEYYEFISDEIEKLSKQHDIESKIDINDGDWIGIVKQYAVEHGERQFGKGKYRVLKKTVLAKNIYTDGNSIQEWGYVK